MSNSYTDFLLKRKPAPGDFNWDDEWHENEDIDDFLNAAHLSKNRLVSGLAPSDGGSGSLSYTAGVVIVGGVRYEVAAGSTALTLAVSGYQINYVYVNSSGAIVDATSPPASGDYVPVAIVDTDTTDIVRLADARKFAADINPSGNIFINGDVYIDQENSGAAVSVSTVAKYFADMLECSPANNSSVVNAQQVTGFGGFSKAGRLIVTTADTLPDGKYGHGFRKFIEYKDCQLIAGRWLAFAFHFQAKVTGVYSIAIQSGDASNSYITTFNYSVADAVQKVPVIIPVPSAKVIEGSNNRGLILLIGACAAGAYATATLNQWQTGTYYAASGATYWESTVSNYISMTGLYGGPDVIPAEFPFRPYGAEFDLCSRYYIKIASSYKHIASGYLPGTTSARVTIPCKIRDLVSVSVGSISNFRIATAAAAFTPTAISLSAMVQGLGVSIDLTISGGTSANPASFYIATTDYLAIDGRM